MRLIPFTSSSHARELLFDDGTRVLFSFQVPVAAFIPGDGYIRTSQVYSNTTTRHVNEWLGHGCRSVPKVNQATLDRIGKP